MREQGDEISYTAYQVSLKQRLRRDKILEVMRDAYRKGAEISDEQWLVNIQSIGKFAQETQTTLLKAAKAEMIFRLANWCNEDIENIKNVRDATKVKQRIEEVLGMIDEEMLSQKESTQDLWKLLNTIELELINLDPLYTPKVSQ